MSGGLLTVFSAHHRHSLHMVRYVQIDVSFREPIQTNIECYKISPFVCGNISTYSVTKKSIDTIRYPYHSLNLACSRKKFNFFIRFYYYSDSNIKVKFCVKPPSPQPCLFFVQRTCQRLFFAPTDGSASMHSTLVS